MRISVISFTENGTLLSLRLKEKLEEGKGDEVLLYRKHRQSAQEGSCPPADIRDVEESLTKWAGRQFAAGEPIVFIGACGIAVRTIAPHLKSKLTDSPVLVMDESGRFVIPLVSGHVGGANELARRIAGCMGAEAVITTATDLNGCFAVDLFAKENQLRIRKREGIAAVSGKLLAGDTVLVSVEGMEPADRIKEADGSKMPKGLSLVVYPPEEPVDILISTQKEAVCETLCKVACPLQPKQYAVGIGCKRGKDESDLESFFLERISGMGITSEDIFALTSIDEKKDEQGLCRLAEKYRIPFITFSSDQLREADGEFHGSAFVEKQMGVDNVCERAALLACGEKGEPVLPKQAENGMTIAIAKRQWDPRQLKWNTVAEEEYVSEHDIG